MPQFTFPKDRQWQTDYTSPWTGTIQFSHNLDFDAKPGYVGIAPRLMPHTFATDTSIGDVSQFILSNHTGTLQFVAATTKIFQTSNVLGTAFTADAAASTPTTLSDADMAIVSRNSSSRDVLAVSNGTDIALYDSVAYGGWKTDWWTAAAALNQPALDNTHPTILAVFQKLTLVANGNKVHSILDNMDGTYTVTNSRLVFAANQIITWMKCTREKVYIGLKYIDPQVINPGLFVEYDLFNEQLRSVLIPEVDAVGFIVDNIPYILDRKGRIKRYNGYTFDLVNQFPTSTLSYTFLPLPHRNGILWMNNKVFFSLNTNTRQLASGVWIWDLVKNQLYRKYSPAISQTAGTDYGWTYDTRSATRMNAIFKVNSPEDILVGARVRQDFTIVETGIWTTIATGGLISYQTNDRAYLTTSRIEVPNVLDAIFRNVAISYTGIDEPLNGSQTGTIIVKCRVKERTNTYNNNVFSWIDGQTLQPNATSDTSGFNIGDEVFVSNGHGAGYAAHITALNVVGGTTNVVLDETFPNIVAGKTCEIDVTNWTKLSPTITDNTQGYAVLDIPETMVGGHIEFKIEIRGKFYVEDLKIGYQPNLIVEK